MSAPIWIIGNMPPLDCPIRERFVQEFVKSGNASESLRIVKPHARQWKESTVNSKASTMLAEGKVRERLSELQERSAAKAGITIESLTEMLLADRALALKTEKASASVQAAMGLAKLHGMIVEKNEHAGKDGTPLFPVINVKIG